jgi:predicted peroxiredoxin
LRAHGRLQQLLFKVIYTMSEAVYVPEVPEKFPILDEDEVYLVIGGIMTSVTVVSEAHDILLASPGLMVRQPLAHGHNPLALCDYHAEAAPYRDQYYHSLTFKGRGAAGRPATKQAFMHALLVRITSAMRDAPLLAQMPLAAEAYAAMRTDVSYVMAMSKMAVAVLSRQHAWKLRSELRQAQQEAMAKCQQQAGEFTCDSKSACGTGTCRFSCGIYQTITTSAGDGKTARPANHRGGPFSSDNALAELEEKRPFTVRQALAS